MASNTSKVPASPPAEFLTAPLREQLTAEAEKLFQKGRVAGGFAAIVRDGKIAWELPFGVADLVAATPFDSNTVFRIGSITKTFTATAIFQLRDDGKLDLDDAVTKFIPELAKSASVQKNDGGITLRQLLSHRSGLGGAIPVEWPYYTEHRSPDRDEALPALGNTTVISEPGAIVRYSNYGFALLGEVVRRVTGVECADHIIEKICKPLGLESTQFVLTDELRRRLSNGYDRTDTTSDVSTAVHVELQFDSPAGGLYSTATDLAKWAGFHLSSEESAVLSLASRQEMRQPQHLTPGWNSGMCMNWMARRVGEVMQFGHGGGLPGYQSEFALIPVHDYGVITFVNTVPCETDVATRIVELVSGALKEQENQADSQPVRLATEPPEEIAKYLGLYLFDGGVTVWLEWWNNTLTVRDNRSTGDRGNRAKLHATGEPGVFAADSPPINRDRVIFQESGSGEVTGFIFEAAFVRKLT